MVRELREGQYHARCTIRQGDEIHELVDELNALASDLQALSESPEERAAS